MRLVIFVSLRMAASAVAPSAPMALTLRLCARGRMGNGERVGVSIGDAKKGGGVYLSEHLGWGGLTRKVGATVRRGESRLRSLAKGVL